MGQGNSVRCSRELNAPCGMRLPTGRPGRRSASMHPRLWVPHPLVSRRDVLNKGSNLFRRHSGATRLHLDLHAVGQSDAAPYLHHAGLYRTRRSFFWRTGLQFTYSVQAQPCICPPSDQQQLLQVPLFVPGAALGAMGPVHQPLCNVEAHCARGQAGQSGQIVDGVTRSGWVSGHEGLFETLVTYSQVSFHK